MAPASPPTPAPWGRCSWPGAGTRRRCSAWWPARAAPAPRTITSADDLQHHLVLVAARGWGLDDEEYAAGLRCLAAPVRDAGGEVVAAIGISGPTTRVTLERVEALAQRVRRAGAQVSAQLGYAGPD